MNNILNNWPNLQRAIQVAISGGYSISVYFDSDYASALDDYQSIKEVFPGFSPNGDISVEIYHPSKYKYIGVDPVSVVSIPFAEMEFSDAANILLDVAADKLELSIIDVQSIRKIATTIAQMEESTRVDAWHMAEAVNYKMKSHELINAEVMFCLANAKLGDISAGMIDAAISYLNSKRNSKLYD